MTNKEIIEDFRNSEFISFIEYLNAWFWENEDEESDE